MLTTSAPQKAAQKPVTWKPRPSVSEIELVSHSISPLTTSAKMPSVTTMIGNVRIFATGPYEGVHDAENDGDPEERQPGRR